MGLWALEFPPVSHFTEWKTLFGHGLFAVNKVVLLEWLAAVIVFGFFWTAGRRSKLVPGGVQNVAEAVIEFVQNQIILHGADTVEALRFVVEEQAADAQTLQDPYEVFRPGVPKPARPPHGVG